MHSCYMVLLTVMRSKITSFTDGSVSNPSSTKSYLAPVEDLRHFLALRDDDVDSEIDSEDAENAFLTVRERAMIAHCKQLN